MLVVVVVVVVVFVIVVVLCFDFRCGKKGLIWFLAGKRAFGCKLSSTDIKAHTRKYIFTAPKHESFPPPVH